MLPGDPEVDGFKSLQMELSKDEQAPIPADFQEWASEREFALRGYIHFDIDGYEMGPFPFASLTGLEDRSRLETYYFYVQEGVAGYDYEQFEFIYQEGTDTLVLLDLTECEEGPCVVKHRFNRIGGEEGI